MEKIKLTSPVVKVERIPAEQGHIVNPTDEIERLTKLLAEKDTELAEQKAHYETRILT